MRKNFTKEKLQSTVAYQVMSWIGFCPDPKDCRKIFIQKNSIEAARKGRLIFRRQGTDDYLLAMS